MTAIKEAVKWGEKVLNEKGLENPSVEVEAILGGMLRVSPSQLYLNSSSELPVDVVRAFQNMVARRSQHEPVAYLLGAKNFYGRDFKVDSSTLIPRPETELLTEYVVAEIRKRDELSPNVMDIGTGSGCIAVTLAIETPRTNVTATDISDKALEMARLNAKEFGVESKMKFIQSNLYEGLGPHFKGDFDIIVSNPPYIPSSIIDQLDQDLRYEPISALDGGRDGLSVLKPLIGQAQEFLKPNGLLVVEIGYDQGLSVSALMRFAGLLDVKVLKDLNQQDRIVSGRKSGSI